VGRARPRDEHPAERDLAVLERQRTRSEVQAPDARTLGSDFVDGRGDVPVEVRPPAGERMRVVLAQRLDVTRLEPGSLQRCDDVRDRRKLPVGKDEAIVNPLSTGSE
jgi:hypothetical protein